MQKEELSKFEAGNGPWEEPEKGSKGKGKQKRAKKKVKLI